MIAATWTEMNKRVKTRWLAALRSGKYRQGTKQLRTIKPGTDQVCHCCLGVLCDLYIHSTAGKAAGARWEVDKFVSQYVPPKNSEMTILPPEVALWAGLLPDENVVGQMGKSFEDLNEKEVKKALRDRDLRIDPPLTVGGVTCSEYNDGSDDNGDGPVPKKNFKQIANMIEQTY